MRIAWTGHRPDVFHDAIAARSQVDALARELVREEAAHFLVGGQRGVDTWAALAAISLRVPFTLFIPVGEAEFAADWPSEDRAALASITAAASHVHVVGGDLAAASTERNRLLASHSDRLIAVWTGLEGGGTAETIAFARAAGVPVQEVVLQRSPSADSARGRGI